MPSAVFERLLTKFESYSLSQKDILTIANHVMNVPTKIVMYEQLSKALSLQQLFSGDTRCVVIFYPTQNQTTGHWTVLLRHKGKPEFEFFDSYGLKYDDEIQYSSYLSQNKPVNQDGVPWLTHLMQLEPQGNTTYNTARLQSKKEQVSTCGAHVLVRIMHSNKPLPYYVSLYGGGANVGYKGLTADDLVVIQLMAYLLPHHSEMSSNEG